MSFANIFLNFRTSTKNPPQAILRGIRVEHRVIEPLQNREFLYHSKNHTFFAVSILFCNILPILYKGCKELH